MSDQLLDLPALLDRLGYAPGETLTINHAHPGGTFYTRTHTAAQITADPTLVAHDGADVWYSINPTSPQGSGRGTAADVTRLAALWADLDIKPGACPDMDTARSIVDTLADMLGTRPVAITYTGHGLQPLWAVEDHALTDPVSRLDAKALLRRFGRLVAHVADRHGAGVDNVFDLPRILRAPGTTNHKAAPIAVLCVHDTGYALTVADIAEQLDAYGVTELPGDRDDLGAPVTDPTDWVYGAYTCTYAARTIAGWASETPQARHPWLMACAVRLASMRAQGCITQGDHDAARAALVARFEHLLATGSPARQPQPGEVCDAFAWATARVAAMPADRVARELGNHPHLTAAPIDPATPFGEPATVASTGTEGTTVTPPASHQSPTLIMDVTRVGEYYGPTEDGTARALVHLRSNQLRYCPQRGRWLHWDGARWCWDTSETHRELIREIAIGLPGGKGWDAHKRRAMSSAGVTGIARLAQTDRAVVVDIDALDARPYEMNTPGGIIDLRTGTLRPADPTALHTKATTVTPDFDASSVLLDRFLGVTFGGDAEVIAYVQRLLGVALIGTVLEQVLPFGFGAGANGKSTLMDAVAAILGSGADGYSMSAPAEMLMIRKYAEHPAEIAQLAGARLVICSELEDGARFAEARVKLLTGGDRINARFMRQDPFTFKPTHTLFLLGNSRPTVATGGDAFWRRLRLIPFEHTVPVAERDPKMLERLIDQGPALLAWMVKGAADYLDAGRLEVPQRVRAATDAYASEQDTVGRFIDDKCELTPAARTPTRDLRAAYERWCTEVGEPPVTAKRFGSDLASRPGVDTYRSHGIRGYRGIQLATDQDAADDPYGEPSQPW